MSETLALAPFFVRDNQTLYLGHVLDLLAALPAGVFQTCVTSPPYFNLRAYGTQPQVWGGDQERARLYCSGSHHIDGQIVRVQTGGQGTASAKQVTNRGSQTAQEPQAQGFCVSCHAWIGELGSEPTPELFIEHIVIVFRAVHRVLRDDATLWLNLGDSFSGSGKGPTGWNGIGDQGKRQGFVDQRSDDEGLGGKQLLMIPARVAIALQKDSWILRQDIIWEKPNPMPESVVDRPSTSHEHLFLFAKQGRYVYNADAVREPYNAATVGRYKYPLQGTAPTARQQGDGSDVSRREREKGVRDPNPAGRNARSVWTIPTETYEGAHFATFARKLVAPCILAGSQRGDLVLDPFAGSGTTLWVARHYSRRSVGLELNEEYAQLAADRFKQAVLPFDEVEV